MHRKLLSSVLILLAAAGLALAQESLLIGPGDTLHIQVFDTPEMEQHPRVTDAGTVPLLFIGDVKVGGLTPGDAALLIENTLKEKQYMLHPRVAVTIEDINTQISILGQVKDPGMYVINTPTSILSVLSIAGGLTDLADRHIAIERHGDAQNKIEYFLSNTSKEAIENQVFVYPGDTVLVPKAGVVYVLGDVGKPGGFPMSDNNSQITVLQALALAGAANKTALLGKARLVRKGPGGPAEVPMELASIQKGKASDIQMQPDDILYVPSSLLKGIVTNSSNIVAAATSAVIYHP
jgi:polysaccharide export outer membrane protein